MRQKQWKKELHNSLVDWSDWIVRNIDSSAIGYPSTSPEERAKQGPGAGCYQAICPEVIMPSHIATTDRAYKLMPKELQVVVYYKYLAPGYKTDIERISAYTKEQRESAATFRMLMDGLFWWLRDR